MPDEERCPLCGRDVLAQEAHVPTSDGQIAHVVCADQEAAQAWARRQRWDVAQGGATFVAIIVLGAVVGPTGWVAVLAIASAALHALVHRRFWYFAIRTGALYEQLARIKDLYELGDMGKTEYLRKREQLQRQIAHSTPSPVRMLDVERAMESLGNSPALLDAATSATTRSWRGCSR